MVYQRIERTWDRYTDPETHLVIRYTVCAGGVVSNERKWGPEPNEAKKMMTCWLPEVWRIRIRTKRTSYQKSVAILCLLLDSSFRLVFLRFLPWLFLRFQVEDPVWLLCDRVCCETACRTVHTWADILTLETVNADQTEDISSNVNPGNVHNWLHSVQTIILFSTRFFPLIIPLSLIDSRQVLQRSRTSAVSVSTKKLEEELALAKRSLSSDNEEVRVFELIHFQFRYRYLGTYINKPREIL